MHGLYLAAAIAAAQQQPNAQPIHYKIEVAHSDVFKLNQPNNHPAPLKAPKIPSQDAKSNVTPAPKPIGLPR